MTNNQIELVEIKYKGKTYIIRKQKEEQEVIPKDEPHPIMNEQHPDEIIVKDYEEKFWNTQATINGDRIEIGWGNGKYLTFFGLPSILITIGGIWYFLFYKKERQEKAEKELEKL